MIRRQPRSTHCISSAASDVYKRQTSNNHHFLLEKALRLQPGGRMIPKDALTSGHLVSSAG
eukprot:1830871-Prorocentrum_lima.AAC.1